MSDSIYQKGSLPDLSSEEAIASELGRLARENSSSIHQPQKTRTYSVMKAVGKGLENAISIFTGKISFYTDDPGLLADLKEAKYTPEHEVSARPGPSDKWRYTLTNLTSEMIVRDRIVFSRLIAATTKFVEEYTTRPTKPGRMY